MIKKQLLTKKISDLVPYERNNKIHGENVQKIKSSIERNEYITPIVVDEDNVILAGHGRQLALMEMGIDEAEVIVVEGLTEKQKADFRISDNRIAEMSARNYENIRLEIEEFDLQEVDIDFSNMVFGEDDDDEPTQDFSNKNKEIDASNIIDHEGAVMCPKCHFEFVPETDDEL